MSDSRELMDDRDRALIQEMAQVIEARWRDDADAAFLERLRLLRHRVLYPLAVITAVVWLVVWLVRSVSFV